MSIMRSKEVITFINVIMMHHIHDENQFIMLNPQDYPQHPP